MKTALVTAKIDPGIKSRVQKIAAKNGVTLSLLISQYFRRIDEENRIPFEEFEPNVETIRAIREARRDRKAGKGQPYFDNAKDFIAALEKGLKKT